MTDKQKYGKLSNQREPCWTVSGTFWDSQFCLMVVQYWLGCKVGHLVKRIAEWSNASDWSLPTSKFLMVGSSVGYSPSVSLGRYFCACVPFSPSFYFLPMPTTVYVLNCRVNN